MKFQLAINMERITPEIDMGEVARHTLEMVQMAARAPTFSCLAAPEWRATATRWRQR